MRLGALLVREERFAEAEPHLEAALETALGHGGPYLVSVEVPRDSEVSPWAFIHPPKP